MSNFLAFYIKYIEDITWLRGDMKFIFKCSNQDLTSERSERVGCRFEHEKINFISPSKHVIFCLLYKPTNYDSALKHGKLVRKCFEIDIFTCENNMLFLHVKI